MQISNWFNAAVNVAIGIFVGIVIAQLGRLIALGFWPIAIILLILIAGYLLFEGMFNRLVDKVFPSGIRPARKPTTRRRAPLPRLLSLPVGIILGVALDWLGLSEGLLALIY